MGKDRLPTTIFQGRTVELQGSTAKKIPLNLLFGDRNDDKVVPKTTKNRWTLKTTAVPESYWWHQVRPEKDSCYMSLYWWIKKQDSFFVANCRPQLESIIPI